MSTKSIVIIMVVIILAAMTVVGYMLLPNPSEVVDQQPPKATVTPTLVGEEVEAGLAVLMDVRAKSDIQKTGRAIGSIHFDLVRLEAGELPSYSKELKTYIYCSNRDCAGKAIGILKSNGFEKLYNLGGLTDWEFAGGEVI